MASNASNTGGYDCKFVETPPDKLVCQICLLVSGTPHQMTCCGRVYCKVCLDEHKKRSTICPNCRKRGHHFPDTRAEQEIKSLKVKCSNRENGCDKEGELRSLNDHLTTCGYALLRCPNKCMDKNILRRDLDHHLKNKCPNRQYQCPHCRTTGRYCDITTTHLDTCPKMEISCPNSDCKVLVARCELADHRSKCQYEAVSCKYKGIGCTKEPLRKDLQQHQDDETFHLHLAIETVNKLQEEMKVMADNVVAGRAGPCVFNMTKFNQHKSSKQEWRSLPFYTHLGGYKMCIKVYTNGFGDGTGTYVSVGAYLMQGRNDDNLSWPFTGEVAFTLLNQLADENHHTRTVSFPQNGAVSRRVVDGEMAPTGYGWSKFISHDQLDHNADQNCQYLKDDCLHFRIKVHAAKPTKPWLTSTV